MHRARMNSLAAAGEWSAELEQPVARRACALTPEPDPLEEHLLAALRALAPVRPLRCGTRGRGALARAGGQPARGLRRPLAPERGSELLHDRVGGPRVERSARARAAAGRPGAPALPLGRLLPRARRPRGHRRRRDVLLGVVAAADEPIAGGRHKVFGRKELAILPMTSTIASHLPRAVGMALAIDRARRLGVPSPWQPDAVRRLLLRRRVDQPRDRAGGAEHGREHGVPGPPAAAPTRVRGQRPRDQRALSRGLGRDDPAGRVRAFATRRPTGATPRPFSRRRASSPPGCANSADRRFSTSAPSAT